MKKSKQYTVSNIDSGKSESSNQTHSPKGNSNKSNFRNKSYKGHKKHQDDKSVKRLDSDNKTNTKSDNNQKLIMKDGSKPSSNQVKETSKKQIKKKLLYIEASEIISNAERNSPIIKTMVDAVGDYIKSDLFIENGSEILVAVSGGVDSIVLLDILRVLSISNSYQLHVAHYNHGLRGVNSDKDEHFVKTLCDKYKLPYHHAKGKVKQYASKRSMSIEQSARVLRYMFLERVSRSSGIVFVATAHTYDDSAETFLLNLIRGSGLTGLSGIPSRRNLGKHNVIIRPLLKFSKSSIIEYAKIRNLEWREDESNLLFNYTRNRIRHELIPLLKDFNPSIIDSINKAARLIHGADEFIIEFIKHLLENIIYDKRSDGISLKVSLMQANSEFIQGELFQEIFRKHFQLQALSLQVIERLIGLLSKPSGTLIEPTQELVALKDRDTIQIRRKAQEERINITAIKEGAFDLGFATIDFTEVSKKEVRYNKNPNIEFFDFDLVPIQFQIRSWNDGDYFIPLGMNGTMKVSDYLINSKISLLDKQNLVLLAYKNEVIWICGMRINDKFKIKEETKRVLKIVYQEKRR